jgi:heme exporter protein D
MHYLKPLVQGRFSNFHYKLGTTHTIARSTSDTRSDFFNLSQAIFAFLSVIIALFALVVGFPQLRKYRRRVLQDKELVFELEACYQRVE